MNGHDWISGLLADLSFVEWDRYTEGVDNDQKRYDVYGWIERDDEYKDFVVLTFWLSNRHVGFITSSSKHSERIHNTIWGDGSVEHHNGCKRVEHATDIDNVVELHEQESLLDATYSNQ